MPERLDRNCSAHSCVLLRLMASDIHLHQSFLAQARRISLPRPTTLLFLTSR